MMQILSNAVTVPVHIAHMNGGRSQIAEASIVPHQSLSRARCQTEGSEKSDE